MGLADSAHPPRQLTCHARLGGEVEDSRTELLVRLLGRHQEALFRYIFALLPHPEDARDVLQETCVALCRKFAEYDATKPFLAWAYRFAYLEVLKQRDRRRRGGLLLSQDVIERLARQREGYEPQLEARLVALDHCLGELCVADRELIRRRYQGGQSTDELVRQSGASRRTLFRNLNRVRRLLMECINHRLTG